MNVYDERTPRFYLGVDLGQAKDWTAIVGIEVLQVSALLDRGNRQKQIDAEEADLRIVLTERGQENYETVTNRVRNLVHSPQLATPWTLTEHWGELQVVDEGAVPPHVAVDATGVGRAVVDMLSNRGIDFYPVQMTGGYETKKRKGFWNVPKKDLIAPGVVAFQNHWVKMAQGLPHREILEKELSNYRIKVNLSTGNESFEAWRERDHDDLVFALCLAIWCAMKTQTYGGWKRRAMVTGVYGYSRETGEVYSPLTPGV